MGRAFSHSYLAGEPAAHAFFAPGFRDPVARGAAARRAAERRLAPALLEVLAEQQTRLPESAARRAHVAALSAGGTAVVATGQQVGLFLGPLYAFYKAASAIAVANAIEAESGVPCVPLFWLQTEDHDFAEIASCRVAGRDGEPVQLALLDADQSRISVAQRKLGGDVTGLLDRLALALEPGSAADEVLALLRTHYQPGRGVAAAFASVMASVFADEGLLIFDPRDPRVAALAAPIYRSAITETDALERSLQERQTALAAAGFDAQVAVRERGALVFFHRDSAAGPRFRIQRQQNGQHDGQGQPVWALAGHPEVISHDDLMAVLAHDPLRFSTSALLRPMVQDALLPTVAYVGGPGEINYFAQLGPLYQHFGITPPLLVPRMRFRCVDARTRRRLEQLGLSAADLALPMDALRARVTWSRPPGCPDPSQLRAMVATQIAPAVDSIADAVVTFDAHLQRPAKRTRDRVAYRLERLIDRFSRAIAERDETTLRRLHRASLVLQPDGVPQERFYAWPSLAGRLGSGAFKRLVLDQLARTGPFVTEVQELQA